MACEFCGKFFHNRCQLGPHKRVCPEKNRTAVSSEHDDENFDPGEQDDQELSSCSAVSEEVDPRTLLRTLATRPMGIWGTQHTIQCSPRRVPHTHDARFAVDYTPVSYSPQGRPTLGCKSYKSLYPLIRLFVLSE